MEINGIWKKRANTRGPRADVNTAFFMLPSDKTSVFQTNFIIWNELIKRKMRKKHVFCQNESRQQSSIFSFIFCRNSNSIIAKFHFSRFRYLTGFISREFALARKIRRDNENVTWNCYSAKGLVFFKFISGTYDFTLIILTGWG